MLDFSQLLYLVAAILFILALRGLSSPSSSRRGNQMGMAGMAIAILTTLVAAAPNGFGGWVLVILGLAIGGSIGAVVARRVAMTAMPQLVAAFHSGVGLAAVCVAAAASYAPQAFGIGLPGYIDTGSLVEMSIGLAIGAITFTGSVIAFAKLNGNMSGRPIMLPNRHYINAGLAFALVALILLFIVTQSHFFFWLIVLSALALGGLVIIPIGGADMPVVVSMLNSYSGWAAAGIGFTLGNLALIITGALVGSSGAILSYIMCAAMNRSFISVILRWRAGGRQRRGGDAPGEAGRRRRCRLHHEKCGAGHHRSWLRHGGRPGAARAARDGGPAQGGGRASALRHPPGGGPHAGPYERAAG
jgi:NAD(P) transhydrogenase subunit beta